MSLWKAERATFGPDAAGLLGQRRAERAGVGHVTNDQAMRHSAVWACRRLRADIVSSLPVSVFRTVGDYKVEMPLPNVLTQPTDLGGGQVMLFSEWLYASQMDLDANGNTIGYIESRDGRGQPNEIRLLPAENAGISVKNGRIVRYTCGGHNFDPADIWHERQFSVSGIPWGLSPIAHAAWTISGYLSAQQFAVDWFSNNITPAAWLKNAEQTLEPGVADAVKSRFKTSVNSGEVFVTGKDWEFQTIGAKAAESQFLEAMNASVTDITRYLGVPGDMIDAPAQGEHITYANVTQRNLQLLVLHMGPVIMRREAAFSHGLVPAPRQVALDEEALLRMDPETVVRVQGAEIVQRTLTPNEARATRNRAPLTPEQEAEFARLFPAPIKPLPSTLEAV